MKPIFIDLYINSCTPLTYINCTLHCIYNENDCKWRAFPFTHNAMGVPVYFGTEPEHSLPWYFHSYSIIPYNFYFFPHFYYLLLWAVLFREFSVKNIHALQIINWKTHLLNKTNKEVDGQRENKTKTNMCTLFTFLFVTTYIKKYKWLIRDIQAQKFLVTVAEWKTQSFAIKFPTSPRRHTWNCNTLGILSEIFFVTIRKHLQDMIFVLERNSEEPHILCIYSMTSVTMFSKTRTNIMSSTNLFI